LDTSASLDDAIAQEERLIRLYEAELALLNGEEASASADEDETPRGDEPAVWQEHDINDDALDWILQLNNGNNSSDYRHQTVSNFLSNTKTIAERSSKHDTNDDGASPWWGDEFQPLLRNFCFTSVNSKPMISEQNCRRHAFTFRGNFSPIRLHTLL